MDRLTYLSGTERQGCSWCACRDSESRAAAQPPGACARTQKVAWRRCCGVQIAAPRCPRRSPARLCHRARRPTKQQRKTGSYTALPVASRWPPYRRRQLRSHLSRHRAWPCCRHITSNMISTRFYMRKATHLKRASPKSIFGAHGLTLGLNSKPVRTCTAPQLHRDRAAPAIKAGSGVIHRIDDVAASLSSVLGCPPPARLAHPLARAQTSPPAIQGGADAKPGPFQG